MVDLLEISTEGCPAFKITIYKLMSDICIYSQVSLSPFKAVILVGSTFIS